VQKSSLADDALVTATAEVIGLPDRKVRIAVGYYAPEASGCWSMTSAGLTYLVAHARSGP
jgi:hypothetical protein